MAEAALRARPRAWRLQFSLRLLIVAFTAFAIGFPIWYRWPYRETIEKRDPATGKLWSTRIITWQRQWGGERLAHGPEQTILDDGNITITMNNVQGNRHGPYTVRDVKGRKRESGQYVDGLKEGRWVAENRWTSRSGEVWRVNVTSWHRGLLDGECEFSTGPKHADKNIATFSGGRLVSYNGQSIDDVTFESLRKRPLDEETAAALEKETSIDFVEQPLKDAMMYIGDLHNIPTVVDPRGGFEADLPITQTISGLDLQSALVLMLAPHGLACDYRYGSLWITKTDKMKDWQDPTGVAEIKPPSGSALARSWDEPIAIDCAAPLANVMGYIGQKMAISIDSSQIQVISPQTPVPAKAGLAPFTTTVTIRNLPLRDALGHVLYNNGCRCKLEGETLVILPPKE
jgi:hypothetical protein